MKWFRKYIESKNGEITGLHVTAIFTSIMILLILITRAIVIIPAGTVGVYDYFGNIRAEELHPGIHIINPLAKVHKMSIRTQEYTMSSAIEEGMKKGDDSIKALTIEGLEIALDITVLYHLNGSDADKVYKELGTDYSSKVIRPMIRSIIREVAARYPAETIYSENRTKFVNEIYKGLSTNLKNRGIILEDVLLRKVTLPAKVKSAIEEKLTAEQEALAMHFKIEREKLEKERKIIEAEGIAQANRIISGSLTDAYLKWYWLESFKDNNNVIYVVSGDMPFPFVKTV